MNKKDTKYYISYITTGDPFIDIGGLALKTIEEIFFEKDLLEIIEYVTDIYIERWNQKLHSVFHTNSKILNPSTKGKHKKNTIGYYNSIIEQADVPGHIDKGYCKTCGKIGRLYLNSREFFPISGSSAFVNFHHSHEKGIFLCNECTLKLFFVPLGVIVVGGKNGFLHAQSDHVRNFWKKEIIIENLNKISRNSSDGILRTEYTNPQNALFKFAGKIIQEISDANASEYLQLINFTNFGASPDCTIHILPNPIFTFLNKVLRYFPKQWYKFINRYYRIKGAKWNIENQQWLKESRKEAQILMDTDYLNNPNDIYEKLLSNKSILGHLLSTYKNRFIYQLEKFPIEITHYYITEVLNMTKEQVGVIARIADVIFELSRKENSYKKYLFMLESAGKAYELRGTLLKIIKANFQSGAKEPLIRMEDYVNYLFPDGQYWGEVRDLLLIHLYEKLHDEGVNLEAIPEEEVVETIENEPVDQF